MDHQSESSTYQAVGFENLWMLKTVYYLPNIIVYYQSLVFFEISLV